MIRDAATLDCARGIVESFAPGADEHTVQLVASLIKIACAADERRQADEALGRANADADRLKVVQTGAT
jgi:hypothetical protein